jgi:hypothetical protein
MVRRSADVMVDMTLRLVGPETDLDLPARLHYRAADPYAVRLIFGLGACEETVEWVFARELLSAGMNAPTGEGDVRIAPHAGDEVRIELSSPSGSAALVMPRGLATHFLLASYELVWPSTESEHVDLDHAVESLLYNGLA